VAILLASTPDSDGSLRASAPLALGKPVVVTLQDGRELRPATIDARTTNQHLWLRYGSGAAVIQRRLAWTGVQLVEQGTLAASPNQIRAMIDESRARYGQDVLGEDSGITDASTSRVLLSRRLKPVSQLHCDAALANWDNDVESDGLQLNVLPLDSGGCLRPVEGTLHVAAWAERHVKFHQVRRERGLQLQAVGTWTVPVRSSVFVEEGMVASLPFRASNPELNTQWSSHGLIHVRLVVPGQGVFERSLDGIRLRPFAPVRDAMEQESGRRFLPNERIGRINTGPV
jgi:hypothetical protein